MDNMDSKEQIQRLEEKIDKLQRSISKLEKKEDTISD